MKCPYRNFAECIVQECPSCNYEEMEQEVIEDISPACMSLSQALKEGLAWKKISKTYKFISCKLIENSVQPIPKKEEIINNTAKATVVVKKSIF